MTFLFDQPITVALLGAALTLLFGVAWMQTGNNKLLGGAAGGIVLTMVLLLVERYVVTDREAIEATLYDLADDIANNRIEEVAAHVARGAPEIAATARAEMSTHHFNDCRITRIHKIIENPEHQPQQIIVEFNAAADGEFMNKQFVQDNVQRWIRVVFWKEGPGEWRVAEYAHAAPQEFLFKHGREQ